MIRRFFQILCIPLYFLLRWLYADIQAIADAPLLYSWYRNRREFEGIGRTDVGDPNYDSKTWKEWKEGAEEMEKLCEEKQKRLITVVIRPKPLFLWLEKNHLLNCSANRELYLGA